jgi:vacuolar-type H+-ATPase subunit E/Vma4
MANSSNSNDSSITPERAMNVVLEAEDNAKLAVEDCAAEAEAILQQARQKAKQISERADERITRIHQRCSRVVTDQVSKLQREQQQKARDSHSYEVDMETVDVVVEQIADMLTSPE